MSNCISSDTNAGREPLLTQRLFFVRYKYTALMTALQLPHVLKCGVGKKNKTGRMQYVRLFNIILIIGKIRQFNQLILMQV